MLEAGEDGDGSSEGSSRQSPPRLSSAREPASWARDAGDEKQRRLEQRVVEQVEGAGPAASGGSEPEARDH